ncbi:MAG: SDR family NAD(P)-dependent oxidoreductase [Deltaproteobacteria bacterium]|uniref:SDR family NAD(P)-dependent oxidoreductase n=1 Tax=Candidatus Zymogenus saltonus TaxID=2844893 RepID=A0A9D8PJL0_9DELT|nr:SDR family NAD(P)-dependent oxidoreductase [Candidatus Zymogenus saltonus]
MEHYKGLFENKVAVVTGAASGIGKAVSLELGRSGANVVCVDKDGEGARDTASSIKKEGGTAEAVILDVTDGKAVEALIKKTAREHGRIDYIFNNAGIGVGGEVRDLKPDHWKKIIDVNLWGVIHGTLAAYRIMIDQGFGHIVNTASLAGLAPTPINTPYAVTKHAVVGLSTSLRAEARDLGVKVSAVCPGVIETNILYKSEMLKADRKEALAQVRIKRMNVDKAARDILKGVKKNKPIIVITPHAKVLWRIQRFFPYVINFISLLAVREFRKIRVDDEKTAVKRKD